MKVLVTGSDGQLASQLAIALKELNWIELLLANKQTLDITDAQRVDSFIEMHRPNVVINTAAFTSVDDAENFVFEANQINHLGAANLAGSAAKIDAVIIQLSTDYVFSGKQSIPYVESDVAEPVNTYGKTKLDGENAVVRSNRKHIVVRTSWIFGEQCKNFYLTILNLLSTKNQISVVNDQIGAPTYVLDVVDLIAKILTKLNQQEKLDWGIYHYSGYPFVSWFDFAKQIKLVFEPIGNLCELTGISTELYNSAAKRPLNSCLNSNKTCDYFGVSPSDWLSALTELAVKRKSNECKS